MGFIYSVQLSIFADTKIGLSANNISNLMMKINSLKIKEFLPNVTTGSVIDLVKKRVDMIPNLTFVTADNSGQIICQNDRIDCIFNFNDNCNLKYELKKLVDVMSVIMEEYGIISNRLALNIDLLSNPYNDNFQSSSFGRNIILPLKFYTNKELKEWSMRENSWCSINIDESEEIVNVISELGTARNNQNNEKRILCHIDINTIPENTEYRFNKNSLNAFIDEVEKIAVEIKKNFEELDSNA